MTEIQRSKDSEFREERKKQPLQSRDSAKLGDKQELRWLRKEGKFLPFSDFNRGLDDDGASAYDIIFPSSLFGGSMTITARFVNAGIRVLIATALLLAVMFTPIRSGISVRLSPAFNHAPSKSAILNQGYNAPIVISARPSLREADSLQPSFKEELDAEFEDELTVTLPAVFASFDVPPSPRSKPCSKTAGFAVPLAVRPLRC